MTREQVQKTRISKEKKQTESFYYQGVLVAGYGLTMDELSGNYFKINFINGVGFYKRGSIGIGTGVRYVPQPDAAVIPFFMDMRLAITRKAISPVIAAGLGTSYQTQQVYYGRPKEFLNTGTLAYGEIGVRFSQNNKSAFMITVGYENFNAFLNTNDNRFRPRKRTYQIGGYTINLALAF